MGRGFTIRGTCINLELFYNQPGCVSFDFFSAWDPAFVNDINREFDMVSVYTAAPAFTIHPHDSYTPLT